MGNPAMFSISPRLVASLGRKMPYYMEQPVHSHSCHCGGGTDRRASRDGTRLSARNFAAAFVALADTGGCAANGGSLSARHGRPHRLAPHRPPQRSSQQRKRHHARVGRRPQRAARRRRQRHDLGRQRGRRHLGRHPTPATNRPPSDAPCMAAPGRTGSTPATATTTSGPGPATTTSRSSTAPASSTATAPATRHSSCATYPKTAPGSSSAAPTRRSYGIGPESYASEMKEFPSECGGNSTQILYWHGRCQSSTLRSFSHAM